MDDEIRECSYSNKENRFSSMTCMTVLRIKIRMDSYNFGSKQQDPRQSRKPDPDPYQNQNSGAVKVKKKELWRVMTTNNGGVEAQNGAVDGLYTNSRAFASL